MPSMPRDRLPDSTIALMIEGYEFISNRCRRFGTEVFEARINLQPTICMRGVDAAELFYDTELFEREGAAPRRMKKTLFGEGGVQGLDGSTHEHRKSMLLSLMSAERRLALVDDVRRRWLDRLAAWSTADEIVLFDEVSRLLTEAVHAWADVPLSPDDVEQRRDDLHAMIVGGGGLGPNYLRGRVERQRAERQLADVVTAVRDGRLGPAPGSALAVIAEHRAPDGEPLDDRLAAVALLNVLRPTVAVDRYIALIALALEEHHEWRGRLRDDPALTTPFVHEVRRYYPFFPFAAARLRRDVEFRGFRLPAGRRVLLDLYATDHDPSAWEQPSVFRPERFVGRDIGSYELVPQGGGAHATGHRCAGEWLTVELMEVATRLLVDAMEYEVPPQDLRLQRGKVPALPTSGVRLRHVRATERVGADATS